MGAVYTRASFCPGIFHLSERKEIRRGKRVGCTDGRPQRDYITKEEKSALSVSALMLSCVIDAMEKRDIASVDIP